MAQLGRLICCAGTEQQETSAVVEAFLQQSGVTFTNYKETIVPNQRIHFEWDIAAHPDFGAKLYVQVPHTHSTTQRPGWISIVMVEKDEHSNLVSKPGTRSTKDLDIPTKAKLYFTMLNMTSKPGIYLINKGKICFKSCITIASGDYLVESLGPLLDDARSAFRRGGRVRLGFEQVLVGKDPMEVISNL